MHRAGIQVAGSERVSTKSKEDRHCGSPSIRSNGARRLCFTPKTASDSK